MGSNVTHYSWKLHKFFQRKQKFLRQLTRSIWFGYCAALMDSIKPNWFNCHLQNKKNDSKTTMTYNVSIFVSVLMFSTSLDNHFLETGFKYPSCPSVHADQCQPLFKYLHTNCNYVEKTNRSTMKYTSLHQKMLIIDL